jgi:hypothetical protein
MASMVSCTWALGLFGLVTACSDPVSPAAQGAASLYLTTVTGTMVTMCPAGAHWVNVPFNSTRAQQTSARAKGAVAIDGQDQMSVECTVKDTGGGVFAVSASLSSPAFDSSNPPNPVAPTHITLSTTIGTDATATGAVSITDEKTLTAYQSADDNGRAAETCQFSVHPGTANDQLGIAAGRMWASVSCPKFRDPQFTDLSQVCAISPGYVVLENCAQ